VRLRTHLRAPLGAEVTRVLRPEQCHEKFLGKFIPTREDVGWMSEYSMIT
jgi:hypothetical protein